MAKKRHLRRTASLLASWHFLKYIAHSINLNPVLNRKVHFQPNNDAGSRAQGLKLTPLIGDGNVRYLLQQQI